MRGEDDVVSVRQGTTLRVAVENMFLDPTESETKRAPLAIPQRPTALDTFQDPAESGMEQVPPTVSRQPAVMDTFLDIEPRIEVVPSTEWTATGPLNESPFSLSNDEIDELLKGLEGIENGILKEEGDVPADRTDIDTELDGVLDSALDMCVEDYIV